MSQTLVPYGHEINQHYAYEFNLNKTVKLHIWAKGSSLNA